MKIFVACEYSGRVRDAFIKRGHDAISCDFLPSESDKGPHIIGDVLEIMDDWGGATRMETRFNDCSSAMYIYC